MLLKEEHQVTLKTGTSHHPQVSAIHSLTLSTLHKIIHRIAITKEVTKALVCMEIRVICKAVCHLLPHMITMVIQCLDMECLHLNMDHLVNQDMLVEHLPQECTVKDQGQVHIHHTVGLLLIMNKMLGVWVCNLLTFNLKTALVRVNTRVSTLKANQDKQCLQTLSLLMIKVIIQFPFLTPPRTLRISSLLLINQVKPSQLKE